MPASLDNRNTPTHRARSGPPRRRRTLLVIGVALAAVLVLVLITVLPSERGPLPPDQAGEVRSTEELIETLGVAVQLQYSADRYETDLRPALAELGVRHIRVGGTGDQFFSRVRELHDDLGIRSLLVMDPRDGFVGSEVPEDGILPALEAVEGVEGPNEWDINDDLTYEDEAWPDGVRIFQEQMYDAVKNFVDADPAVQQAVRDVTVLSPSVAFPENAEELGQVPCDVAAIHSYPGGDNLPDNDLDDRWLPQGAVMCPGAPVQSTESGYCNELTEDGCTNQGGVSERASAKYALRHYMEYFTRGVQRDYLYNLATDEWDLFLRENGERKPAFAAVRSFIDLLEEPGAQFSPEQIDIGISTSSPDLRRQLLQKSDGTYVLAMWMNTRSYEAGQTCCDIETEVPVTVELPDEVDATVYLPTFNGTEPVSTMRNTRTLDLSVPDHVMLVELS